LPHRVLMSPVMSGKKTALLTTCVRGGGIKDKWNRQWLIVFELSLLDAKSTEIWTINGYSCELISELSGVTIRKK